MKRFINFALVLLVLASVASAGIPETLNNICYQLRGMMPIVAFVLIVFAGLIYAAGQVLGAEMRSRTNVWATSMVVGAIIGLLFVAAAPAVINLVSEAMEYSVENQLNCEELV